MDMTIDQQVALDEALVPHASRLRIGKSNFRLRSDITSKESTLQVERKGSSGGGGNYVWDLVVEGESVFVAACGYEK
uniref:Uncharacterized protein n=1 Tax=Tanacetum cinerariifolium TaxID=118510 RepID=A0A699HIM4_TANCI|nr:hypothetical protein [Tanacetum cinerariifolium]